MKKGMFLISAIVLAVFFVCGNGIAAKINIDVNCTMKPGGSEEAAINKFKEIVEQESNGRMYVKIFMSGQLGNSTTDHYPHATPVKIEGL